jgi:cation diffusion facilitator CzcD-associated flavoprotein CzcO
MEQLTDRSLTAALVTSHHHDALPARARVVIVGGGIVGASVAAHLAAEGERDVLVLEANRFGSGTSWHAAGLVTGARATGTLTKLAGACTGPCRTGPGSTSTSPAPVRSRWPGPPAGSTS